MKLITVLGLLIFKLPLVAVRIVFTHRAVLIVVIILVGFLVLRGMFSGGSDTETERAMKQAEYYHSLAPNAKTAPYVFVFHTRVVYAQRFDEQGVDYILTHWYEYNEDKWERHSTPLPLPKNATKYYPRGGY